MVNKKREVTGGSHPFFYRESPMTLKLPASPDNMGFSWNLTKLNYLFMINHKMFVEVDEKDLVIGTKYTIISSYDEGIYITATLISNIVGYSQKFENPEHSGIENVDTYNILLSMRNKQNNPNYFVFIPQKLERICPTCCGPVRPLSDYEMRALDASSPDFRPSFKMRVKCDPCRVMIKARLRSKK